ncbi:MAG: hypothetical protein ACLTSX_08380 [Collinsella sp.]
MPDDPGCYLWKDAMGAVIYVARPDEPARVALRQYVTLHRRSREDPAHDAARWRASTTSSSSRARGARPRARAHRPASPVLQRRLQGRQDLSLHRRHARRRLPGDQVHAREAQAQDALLRSLHG